MLGDKQDSGEEVVLESVWYVVGAPESLEATCRNCSMNSSFDFGLQVFMPQFSYWCVRTI